MISDHRTRYPLTIGRYDTAAEAAEAANYAAGAGEWYVEPVRVAVGS